MEGHSDEMTAPEGTPTSARPPPPAPAQGCAEGEARRERSPAHPRGQAGGRLC